MISMENEAMAAWTELMGASIHFFPDAEASCLPEMQLSVQGTGELSVIHQAYFPNFDEDGKEC